MSQDPRLPKSKADKAASPAGSDGRDPVQVGEDLAAELHTIIRIALEKFGVDEPAQAKAFERARALSVPEPASGLTMRMTWGLSNLLTEWSRTHPYVDEDGRPKILKLHGKGVTFEALANRFLPGSPLAEVIGLARQSAEVELLSKDRIALLGSILVKTTVARQTLLAHGIRHIDQLLQTMLHNLDVQQGTERDTGSRMERMVLGVIRQDRFADFMSTLRPQIYNLMLQVDSAVEQRAPTTQDELKESTAVVVGVYVSEESDWERIGINPLTVIPTEP